MIYHNAVHTGWSSLVIEDRSLELRFIVVASADVAAAELVAFCEAVDSLQIIKELSKERGS